MAGVRLVRVAHHALVFVIVVASMLVLSAQTVVNPRYVEFNASSDHSRMASDGITPLVASYALSIYPQGSAVPFATVNVGKPTPNGSGIIRVDFLPLLTTPPIPGVNYEARVTALGPGGSAESALSNSFTFTAPCAPVISPTSATATASAMSGSVAVTAAAGCAWGAVSNAGWITVTSGANGSGDGFVNYSVAANPTATQRVGTMTIAGVTFTITQAGVSCTVSVSPSSASAAAAGATGTTNVTTPAGCSWTAVSNATSWLTVTGGASGNGSGTVSYSVASNPQGTTRQGTLTISGQTFTVNQAAAPCTYSITPGSTTVAAGGGTGSTTMTATPGCSWTAVSNATSWLTVTGGANGTGNGTVTFSAAANSQAQTRQGTITIGGQTFTVNQSAAPCTYSISPGNTSVAAGATTGSTTLTTLAGCSWTAVSNATSWLTVTAGSSGSGSGTVSYSVAANSQGTTRQGTITIGGQTLTVNQAAAPCTYSIAPGSTSVSAGATTGSTTLTTLAGCSWTAVSSATSWLTVTSGASGSGSGTVAYAIAANPQGTTRQGTITIGGQTFTVNQAAAPCVYSISPGSTTVVAGGGTGSTTMTATPGCSWTAVSNATSWLTVTGGAAGSGNGTVTFSAAANGQAQTRQGTITIGGQTFTVNQSAAPCTYAITPASTSAGAAAMTGSTTLTTLAGCAWTAVSNATSWLTITAGANGTGSGTVSYSIAANPQGTTRQGTITIGGQTFTVNQSASPCSYSISPGTAAAVAGGGTGSTAITATPGCSWTAVSNATSWLTVTAGASGSGNGTVSYSVAANPQGTTRQGTITIGGQTFTIDQAAAPCTYSIAPGSTTVAAAGGTGSTTMTATPGCSWTTTSNATWLTVTGGASGTGNGTVTFSAAANSQAQTRQGTITIGGQTFTVNQSAASCTYSITPGSTSVGASATTGSTSLTTLAGCSWTAVSNATSWLTVSAGSSGSGSGTVSYSIAANPQGTTRQGTITIGGQTFTVNQAAAPCSYSISPGTATAVASGGTGSTTVTATAGCSWTAVSSATAWLTVTTGASGSGNGTVSYSVAANPQGTTRQGTITIGGQTFTVNQAAAPCTYAISPGSTTVAATGATGSTTMTATPGCTWIAVSNATSWLTVTAGASGSGNGSVTFAAAQNPDGVTRHGTITVGGQTFTVNQSAAPCANALSSSGRRVGAGRSSGSTTLNSPNGCTWTAVSNSTSWLTVTAGSSGIGTGTVSYEVEENPTAQPRQGIITIGGQTFTVDQDGAPCVYSLSPASATVAAGGGVGSTSLTATPGCSWTAVSNASSWLTVAGTTSGTGDGTVTFSAAANTVAQARQGTIAIGGQTFTVDQAAAPCTYSLAPASVSIAGGASTGTTTVTAPNGCAWSATVGTPAWLSVTAGGSGTGNGTMTFAAAANTTTTPRVGTIVIGGQTLTVNQAAAGCSFAIAPTSAAVAATGGTGSMAVTSPAGCVWSASSGASWVTITAGAGGSGNGTVFFAASANPLPQARQGTITVGGQTFSVNQAAASCSYSIVPSTFAVVGGGGAGSSAVMTTAACSWTAQSNVSWITVTNGATGTGNGTVTFTVGASTSTSQRTGTLTIAGRTLTVTQGASSGCQYSLNPQTLTIGPGGGSSSTVVNTNTGCIWTAASSDSWITINTVLGWGTQTVAFTVATNTSGAIRTGRITIAGQTLTVTQQVATAPPATPRNLKVVIAINGGS